MVKQPEDHKAKKNKKAKKDSKTMADVTSASAWKKTAEEDNEPIPLEVPSGNTCLVRPVGMQAFLAENLIPNSLLGIITTTLDKAEKGETIDEDVLIEGFIADIRTDPAKLADMIKMADACTLYCVLQPEVLPSPKVNEPRLPDKLYVDEVDLDDKLFIMNFAVGGSRDLEPFREKLAEGVDAMAADPGVGETTE